MNMSNVVSRTYIKRGRVVDTTVHVGHHNQPAHSDIIFKVFVK